MRAFIVCNMIISRLNLTRVVVHVGGLFFVVIGPGGAWEYAGTIGNGYSFAHPKYVANP